MSYIASAQSLNRAIFIHSGVGINEKYISQLQVSRMFTIFR